MREPLVSVIIPAYNSEKYVLEAIESVLFQTYRNLEVIVVDDKSTDNTLSIISSIKDERLHLYRNECNRGIAYTTNRAVSLSRGEYIALMDDDDISMPDRLKIQVDFLEKNREIDIIGGMAEIIDQEGLHISYGNTPKRNPKYIKAMLLFRCLDFCNSSTMIRKAFIEKYDLRYKDDYYGMQDYQFFIEASKIGKISSIDDFLIKKRLHDKNETYLQMNNNAVQRAEKYSSMRRNSFEISGFNIADSQMDIIDKAFPETNMPVLSKEELVELYLVLKTIYTQAFDMKIDYLEELVFAMKKLYSESVYRSDLFK